MVFRKLRMDEARGSAAITVRIANLSGKYPRVILPISILDALGAKIGSRVDLMIDDSSTPPRLAIVYPGHAAKIIKGTPSSKSGTIMSALLSGAIPKCRTTPVDHEITRINACAAVVFSVPAFGDDKKPTPGDQST